MDFLKLIFDQIFAFFVRGTIIKNAKNGKKLEFFSWIPIQLGI